MAFVLLDFCTGSAGVCKRRVNFSVSGLDPDQGGGTAAEKSANLQRLGVEFGRKVIEVAAAQGMHLPVAEAMESFSFGDTKGTTGRLTLTSQFNHRALLAVEDYTSPMMMSVNTWVVCLNGRASSAGSRDFLQA
uniref:Uncharacterized protein n=1 Tax=Heterosigma akashiwo TaxID=2829 RepID=A0A6V1S5N3_HETAK|mmetsp:Transcript_32707/g.56929  ORF Transcript_32707/g.56929 Transcript_32707/m.56929 type:complete len:134 (-) Transcript_32707:167-568(-)